jgi:hypothetical protein
MWPAMVTDWILIRRAAGELERELRGSRVTDAGLLDDGRFGIRLGGRRKGGDIVLAIDIFGSPPRDAPARRALDRGGPRLVALDRDGPPRFATGRSS